MEPFIFDLSRWPLVVVTAPRTIDERVATEGVERLRSLLSLHSKIVVLLDVRARAERPSPIMRRHWSELLHAIEPELKRSVAAWAVVTHSALLRAAYTAILWVAPAPCPAAFFSTMDEAAAWLNARVAPPVRRVA
jgi:hypothetical protein